MYVKYGDYLIDGNPHGHIIADIAVIVGFSGELYKVSSHLLIYETTPCRHPEFYNRS